MAGANRGQEAPSRDTPNPFESPTGRADGEARYVVKDAPVPIGYDYIVEDERGGVAYRVDGKLLSIRESLAVNDAEGGELLRIQGTLLDGKDVLHISRGGTTVATVRKSRPELDRDAYAVDLPGSKQQIAVVGRPADHDYGLSYEGHILATASRPRLPLAGRFHLRLAAGQDHAALLAIAVCLDVMSR